MIENRKLKIENRKPQIFYFLFAICDFLFPNPWICYG